MLNEVNQTPSPYHSSASYPLSRVSTDTTSQYFDPNFKPSHPQASYQTFHVGDYQCINVSDGVPNDIGTSNAHCSTNGPIDGFNQHNLGLIIPDLPHAYGKFPEEYQYPVDGIDAATRATHNQLTDFDIINHSA